MLRKSIVMMALAAAFTMNVSAVQIEVPKGQTTCAWGRCEYSC